MTITQTNFELSTEVEVTIKHVLANLPVFKVENTPMPTTNEHFILHNVDEVRQWYTENLISALNKYSSIVLVATEDGFRIELIAYWVPQRRQP
jgi:hypothetical protein